MECRQRKPPIYNRAQSADCIREVQYSSHTSMLFSMLPVAVQARIPKLPYLGRSARDYGLSRPSSPDSKASSGSDTPELGYTSAIVLSHLGEVKNGNQSYFGGSVCSDDGDLRISASHMPPPLVHVEPGDSRTGIAWKFANQGLSLLGLAVEECCTISRDGEFGNSDLARQLYMHALTYLLRALPSDLNEEERSSLRSSLPHRVVEPLEMNTSTHFTDRSQSNVNIPSQPSFIHRTLASTIIQIFLFFQLILPYVKNFLQAAYRYDREHKVSEKVLTHSISTIDEFGKQTLAFTTAIYGIGDGKLGRIITETAVWVVEGITGGIHEGVGEGIAIVGARRSAGVKDS
ncbi:hypothetical protein GLAREA_03904 [Glarea lozoyensis ATCC 20868]|uniref:Uncharacterized protein n=1 Tax=Glarea lozoyensis (strain ATCC 20868 / MF5171) TaxID=1116229 RepID=S3CX63_GLAL2|nr:uncharacterized protein GLAREA_03904 [Glarea lozoyensis ATCC 20868]EPE30937.1 hypothetical protein GLAREA_03904 [Glarea lozoyensis ATCC 20868]